MHTANVIKYDQASGLFVAQLPDLRCAVLQRVSGATLDEGVTVYGDIEADKGALLTIPASGGQVFVRGSGQLVTKAQALKFLREFGGAGAA